MIWNYIVTKEVDRNESIQEGQDWSVIGCGPGKETLWKAWMLKCKWMQTVELAAFLATVTKYPAKLQTPRVSGGGPPTSSSRVVGLYVYTTKPGFYSVLGTESRFCVCVRQHWTNGAILCSHVLYSFRTGLWTSGAQRSVHGAAPPWVNISHSIFAFSEHAKLVTSL